MEPWLIALCAVLIIILIPIALTLICFFKIYYSPRRKPAREDEYPTPSGKAYDPYRERMVEWIKAIRGMPHKAFEIASHDGLKLSGKYYEYKKGAPIEIMFHGYRGTSERDLCGGVYRAHSIGHSALIVDHRASGFSEGSVITFGAKESRDCLGWIDLVLSEIDPDARIILTGISMGAATVMMAASMDLPENVIGVLADCGYTSAEAIIKKVIGDMHLPPALIYPFARLAARLLGGFDPSGDAPIKSMKKTTLPIIFFHGDADSYVPSYMSEENYAACASANKRLVITPGAEHGICFSVGEEKYIAELRDFFGPIEQASISRE